MATSKNTNQVLSTSDYTIFKRIGGNRNVNESHVKKLQAAMARLDLKIPIILNEKMEVIDGQHRLQARKNLKIPVFYTIIEGLGLHETQVANANNKNWTLEDFAKSFAEQNFYSYKQFLQFRKRYQFGYAESIAMLTGNDNAGGGHSWNAFKAGEFYVGNIDKANAIAEKIYQIQPFYVGFKRRSFVDAMLTCFKMDEYDHEDFIQKLSYQSSKLVDCSNKNQYLRIIDEIYNFKRKIEDKIRFF